jgi:hypothetical protein
MLIGLIFWALPLAAAEPSGPDWRAPNESRTVVEEPRWMPPKESLPSDPPRTSVSAQSPVVAEPQPEIIPAPSPLLPVPQPDATPIGPENGPVLMDDPGGAPAMMGECEDPDDPWFPYFGPLLLGRFPWLYDRLWLRAEYLDMWTQGARLPPLVTTGEGLVQDAGKLGLDSTQVLLGNETVLAGARSGGRFTLGAWLTPCHCESIEVTYLFLGTETSNLAFTSALTPVLARPYFDAAAGAQSAFPVAYTNLVTGDVTIESTSDFQAAELLLRRVMVRRPRERLDLVVGYRYARLEDFLGIHQFSHWTHAQPGIQAGTTKNIDDLFDTTNQFHGGEFGVVYERRNGRWSLEMLMKMGLGVSRAATQIEGQTVTQAPLVGESTVAAGLLAQASNMGQHVENDFAVMPELGLTLGCNVTRRLRWTFGYTFLYWSKVTRPGDQIDLALSQIPPAAAAASARPTFLPRTTDFWAQGINTGLDFRF